MVGVGAVVGTGLVAVGMGVNTVAEIGDTMSRHRRSATRGKKKDRCQNQSYARDYAFPTECPHKQVLSFRCPIHIRFH